MDEKTEGEEGRNGGDEGVGRRGKEREGRGRKEKGKGKTKRSGRNKFKALGYGIV